MTKITRANIKRWAVSSLITFAGGFAVAILPSLNDLSLTDLETGAYVGVLFTAVRAGLKAVVEAFVLWYGQKTKK